MAQQFKSKNDHAAATRAQKEFDEQGIQGQRPLDAAVYEGEVITGDEPMMITTQWGEVTGQPGDWVFTDSDGNQFVVHDNDVQNLWQEA